MSAGKQFIVVANDPQCGYPIYWTGISYSRLAKSAFRCDSREFADASASMCNAEQIRLVFSVEESA